MGVLVVTFLLTMDFLFDYLDLFLGKGIDLLTVVRLFFLGLGWMLALSVPCGVLVSVLMTYGRLSQDNEIVALKASGMSLTRAIWPAVAASVFVAGGLAAFNDYVLPDMNHSFASLLLAVNKVRPTAEIREGVFIEDFEGYNMFIGRLDEKTGRMSDILIYDFSKEDEPPRTIIAKKGHLRFDEATATLRLHLEDGEVHEAAGESYRRLEFKRQVLVIHGVRRALEERAKRSRGQREMNIAQMKERIGELEKERRKYLKRGRKALKKIGLESFSQLPGMKKPPTWYALLAWVFGKKKPPSPPPEDFWTPQRRKTAEEAKIASMQAFAAAKKINQYKVEIHKKFSIPFACIVFALVGAPLGIKARRGGLAAGFISVAFFIFYYLCLVGGEQLADRMYIAPWFAMWFPNIVLGILGLVLVARVCEIRFGRTGRWDRGSYEADHGATSGRIEGLGQRNSGAARNASDTR